MEVFHSIADFTVWRKKLDHGNGGTATSNTIGFVPTMGALHVGHRRLLEESNKDCAFTVLSIFVNPTQFNQPEDFAKYPKTLEYDLEIARAEGVDAVFAPTDSKEMYSDGYRFSVSESEESKILCGAFRPGHFNGVLTVVLKLFQIVRPTIAFFGEKDFQQFKLIRDMSSALFLPVNVHSVETIREKSGLALSSRNTRLSEGDRIKASALFKALVSSAPLDQFKPELTSAGFQVEYLEEHWGRRFVAAWIGGVRLIDNVSFENRKGNAI